MRIIVFGGSGFLGSHVCDKLSDAGHDVVIYDIRNSPWLRSNQKMLTGDILDPDAINQAMKGADVVFNFAGIADIGEANNRAVDSVRYNILGNALILDACVKEGVKRYIFASSVYVYSKAGGFYRCSKQACELYIENYHRVYGLEYTILRYGSLYGPRSDERNAIHRFVREATETGKITYYGSPHALREYIHVEDAALSSVEILKAQFANEHIILTGYQPMRVGDLLKMIAEMLAKPIEFIFEDDQTDVHYEITPYSFSPNVGKKFFPQVNTDLGQGVLKVIEDQFIKTHSELHSVNGLFVEEENKQ